MQNLSKCMLALALVVGVVAQADKPNTAAAKPEWMKYTVPGEGHKLLKDMEGKWAYTMEWWAAPDAKPEKSNGTSTNKLIFGGRFLQQEVNGKAMGQKFEGRGYLAFDSFKGEYQSTWFDNMSTAIMWMPGTFDETNKVLKTEGKMSDPMAGDKDRWVRTETKIVDPKKHTFAMFSKDKDGKEFKTMEMTYTKR